MIPRRTTLNDHVRPICNNYVIFIQADTGPEDQILAKRYCILIWLSDQQKFFLKENNNYVALQCMGLFTCDHEC